MRNVSLASIMMTLLLGSTVVNAAAFGPPIKAEIPLQAIESNQHGMQRMASETKTIYFMNMPLTAIQQKQILEANIKDAPQNVAMQNSVSIGATLPRKIDLGMNGVPVLDQGDHGTCVTFAVTAVIDALLQKGDYVSQLCNLELGSYLAKYGYAPSGWEGSYPNVVLAQIMEFGIINKTTQTTKSCAGIKTYALSNEADTGNPIALADYAVLSEETSEIYSKNLLDVTERFSWSAADIPNNMEAVLQNVKKELATSNNKARIVIASYVFPDACLASACGSYHQHGDTFVLSDEVIKQAQIAIAAGHEMIITGYDDDAIVKDSAGNAHTGVLIIRNSWSDRAGDKGTYYMTYDFFKKFVVIVDKVATY